MAALIADARGGARGWCSINGVLVGALGWAGQDAATERAALLNGAGAFECAAMTYLRVSGRHAAALLSFLSPRDLTKLAIERAAFAVLTTSVGTVADEIVVMRVGPETFLLSAGACRELPGLDEARARFPSVQVEPAREICFNLKGPRCVAAMGQLLDARSRVQIATLRPFQLCSVRTGAGALAYVLRTKIGIELWAEPDAVAWAWTRMLATPETFTPCGWDTLHRFRLDCEQPLLPLYPLDLHEGISLHATGHAWMLGDTQREFIGKQALRTTSSTRRLVKLRASRRDTPLPRAGCTLIDHHGAAIGHVTSSARALRSGIPTAFALIEGHPRSLRTDTTTWTICHDTARSIPAPGARQPFVLRASRADARATAS